MTKVILKTKELQWWRFWTRDLTVSLILCWLLCQSANLQLLPSSNEPKGNCFSINARLLFPITEKWAQVVSRLFISFSWLPHQLGQKFEPNFTSLSWTRFSASRLFIKFFFVSAEWRWQLSPFSATSAKRCSCSSCLKSSTSFTACRSCSTL